MNQFPAETLSEIKAHLLDEQTRLATRIEELSGQDPFSDPGRTVDNAASDAEASEESNHDRVSALVDELKKQAEDVALALRKIDDGTYGFCTECGSMIDTDRLAIHPTATMCLQCEMKKASAGKK
ncbi:TraR/DksA C4-type zinc finger protein [Patescibacteria group bacterium]|nr:TraR/DksA C4-type zinc finger protein [Patescibacteria group bacterium]